MFVDRVDHNDMDNPQLWRQLWRELMRGVAGMGPKCQNSVMMGILEESGARGLT
jgi:hypothetical protein